MGYLLGIDAGQTVVKAVLFDEGLNELTVGRAESPNESPEPRFVERSHDDLWRACSSAIQDALASASIDRSAILGVGLTGHGDGLHLVDDRGSAVGPAIMAVDSRAYREMEEILGDQARAQRILSVSGQVPFLGSTGVIMAWVHRHHPELLDRADAMLSCKDVLRLCLTGEVGTDYSDASASFLDVGRGDWSTDVLADYGLSGREALLPPLHSSVDVVGRVSETAADATGLAPGTPVVAGCHDVHAAALGMGSLREETLTLIAGSFSINAVTTRSTATDARWQSRASLEPGLRIAMSTSATASTTLEWVLRTLGYHTRADRNRLFREASELPLSDDSPVLLPYLYASPFGEVPSGTFLGLRSWHTPAHLLRATLEGLVWMHMWHTSALSDAFSWSGTARIGGGVSRSPLYSQMVADALDVAVETVTSEETGGYGAAALAGLGTGVYASRSEALDRVKVRERFEPDGHATHYWQQRREMLLHAHDQLGPVWSSLAR